MCCRRSINYYFHSQNGCNPCETHVLTTNNACASCPSYSTNVMIWRHQCPIVLHFVFCFCANRQMAKWYELHRSSGATIRFYSNNDVESNDRFVSIILSYTIVLTPFCQFIPPLILKRMRSKIYTQKSETMSKYKVIWCSHGQYHSFSVVWEWELFLLFLF